MLIFDNAVVKPDATPVRRRGRTRPALTDNTWNAARRETTALQLSEARSDTEP